MYCSREPGVLLMSPSEVAMRLLALKSAVPNLDIQELVRRRPKVLRDRVCIGLSTLSIMDGNNCNWEILIYIYIYIPAAS